MLSTQNLNGNISEIQWQRQGSGLKNYRYTYDNLNRIKSATDNTGNFSLNDITYDASGNIQTLKRTGTDGLMDDLSYNYNGNQLLSVTDNGDAAKGFIDGNVGSDDYSYDVQGNLSSDKNKGISSISYNYLNLPESIIFDSGDKIAYQYASNGEKLQQTLIESTGTTVTR